jgi:DNA-directed RNA polymerase subunit RPC12/RpoP
MYGGDIVAPPGNQVANSEHKHLPVASGVPSLLDKNSAEPCFSGAVTGETEINCPHCGDLLTVTVNDPMGEESYQCGECSGAFEVDWAEGQVSYDAQ